MSLANLKFRIDKFTLQHIQANRISGQKISVLRCGTEFFWESHDITRFSLTASLDKSLIKRNVLKKTTASK